MQDSKIDLTELDKMIEDLVANGFASSDQLWAPSFSQQLANSLDQCHAEEKFKPARTGPQNHLNLNSKIRSDEIYWLDEADSNTEIKSALSELEQIRLILNRELYLGLKKFEAHFARYEPNGGYQKHMDRQIGQTERAITFILYLNSNWNKSDQGELVVFDSENQNDIFKVVEPKMGRFVLFLSEKWPHQVRASNKVRKSLTGWFRTD